ncbi:MAG TPA: thermonuclease family protein [Naasia sp.]|jgi:micrococcal nuclease
MRSGGRGRAAVGVLAVAVVAVIAVAVYLMSGLGMPGTSPADPAAPVEPGARPDGVPAGTAAEIDRVVDGDTVIVLLDGRRERLRLLNIDTPESVAEDQPVECLGPEASDFTAELLPEGSRVTLVFDTERTDQYDRLLAAVYTADGRNASVEIARAGLAYPVTFAPNDRFRPDVDAAVAEAREADRGVWEPGACP